MLRPYPCLGCLYRGAEVAHLGQPCSTWSRWKADGKKNDQQKPCLVNNVAFEAVGIGECDDLGSSSLASSWIGKGGRETALAEEKEEER